jgi:hypothetical protein
MNRMALALGIFVTPWFVLCAGCQQHPDKFESVVPEQRGPVYHSQQLSPNTQCNGAGFVANQVRMITREDFDFNNNGLKYNDQGQLVYKAPPDDKPVNNSAITQDIAAAFEAMPSYLQTFLCTQINVMFVDSDNQAPMGWSFWETSFLQLGAQSVKQLQGVGQGRFIAVGARLWEQGSAYSQISLPNLERQILQRLLLATEGKIFYEPPVTIIPDEPTSTLPSGTGPGKSALIAIIAREAGFVFEFEQEPVKYWTDCGSPQSGFYDISWQKFPVDRPEQGSIHYFGRHSSYFQHLTSDVPPIEEIQDASIQSQVKTLKSVYGVTSTPEFVNLLATVSPYDDFVETFRLKVLKDYGLAMNVKFANGTSVNIISNLMSAGSKLSQKYNCMTSHINKLFPNQSVR